MLFHACAVTPALFALVTPLQVITVAMLMQMRYVDVSRFDCMSSNFHQLNLHSKTCVASEKSTMKDQQKSYQIL